MDPLDLELFHIGSRDDIEVLYKKIILPKRIKTKISPKHVFNKADSKINTVSLDISHGCTLKCSYCYLSAGYKKKELMSKEQFIEILKFISNKKTHDITFYFAGEGEPTLNFELLKQIPQLCRDYGLNNIHFEITTNGTMLSTKVIDLLKKENFSVSVSLDGDKEDDRNRIFLNGNPSFSTVIKNISALKENGIDFACKSTIIPDNSRLVQTFHFFEENKIPFYFGVASRSFDGSYIPKISDVRNNLKQQLDFLVDYYVQRIKENKYVYARKLIEDIKRILYRTTSFIGCSAGINSFYFNLKGEIYVCSCHNSCRELCVGDIHSGIDYEKIAKLSFYPKIVEEYDRCKDCWLRHLCSGSCIAAKWIENKDTTIPSKYNCALNAIYWEAIIHIYISIQPYIKNNINFIE